MGKTVPNSWEGGSRRPGTVWTTVSAYAGISDRCPRLVRKTAYCPDRTRASPLAIQYSILFLDADTRIGKDGCKTAGGNTA